VTVTITGTLTAPSVPATAAPSKARFDTASVAINGMEAAPDPITWGLWVGRKNSAGAPAIFSDFDHTALIGRPADGLDSTYRYTSGVLRITVIDSGEDQSFYTVGDQLYLFVVFDLGNPPAGGTVVQASLRLPLLVA
jgi:hypothetical protein